MASSTAPARVAAVASSARLDSEAVMARAGGENFPVASLLLPGSVRGHLLAIYGFARLVDELGDARGAAGVRDIAEGVPGDADMRDRAYDAGLASSTDLANDVPGNADMRDRAYDRRLASQIACGDTTASERLEALTWLEGELEAAYQGQARHPLMRALSPTLAACELPREPFLRLIEANRLDQRVRRYETWEQLQEYCALSANPVGELVLRVFGLATPRRIALSDRICTALQLVEHCQDVAEDLRENDRVYLPAADMRKHGCEEHDLHAASAGAPLRAVIALQLRRVRALIAEGRPLIGELRGRQRLAIAAYAAGGLAAAEAIEAAGCDVLAGTVKASRLRRLRALGRVMRSVDRSST